MKTCPRCQHEYEDRFQFCPGDGSPLVPKVENLEGLTGSVFAGQFQIQERLYGGVFGETFNAVQTPLNRHVLVNVYHGFGAASDSLANQLAPVMKRFAGLQHPNISMVYEAGFTPDGRLFVASEHVGGIPLQEILRDNVPMEPERVLNLFQQIADALQYVHERMVEHGHLTAEDILVYRDSSGHECVQIRNFGITRQVFLARLQKDREEGGNALLTPGEVSCLAPGLCAGSCAVDDQDDIYAFGALLYQALSGMPLFEAPTAEAMMEAHISVDVVPLRNLPAFGGLDPRWDDLMAGCLAKEKAGRFASIQEAKLLLRKIRGKGPGEKVAETSVDLGYSAEEISAVSNVRHKVMPLSETFMITKDELEKLQVAARETAPAAPAAPAPPPAPEPALELPSEAEEPAIEAGLDDYAGPEIHLEEILPSEPPPPLPASGQEATILADVAAFRGADAHAHISLESLGPKPPADEAARTVLLDAEQIRQRAAGPSLPADVPLDGYFEDDEDLDFAPAAPPPPPPEPALPRPMRTLLMPTPEPTLLEKMNAPTVMVAQPPGPAAAPPPRVVPPAPVSPPAAPWTPPPPPVIQPYVSQPGPEGQEPIAEQLKKKKKKAMEEAPAPPPAFEEEPVTPAYPRKPKKWFWAVVAVLLLGALAAGAFFVYKAFTAKSGRLIVESAPKGARVYLDGNQVGMTPFDQSVKIGPHTLKLALEGFAEFETKVDIRDSESFRLDTVRLVPVGPAAAAYDDAATRLEEIRKMFRISMEGGQFFKPEGASAADYYNQIVALSPADAEAANAKATLVEKGKEECKRAVAANNFPDAERILSLLVQMEPADTALQAEYQRIKEKLGPEYYKKMAAIRDLLKKSDAAMGEGRLLSPSGNSAVEFCRQALALDAKNKEATNKLNRIKVQAQSLIERAIGAQDYNNAIALLKSFQTAFPGDRGWADGKLAAVDRQIEEAGRRKRAQEEEAALKQNQERIRMLFANGAEEYKRRNYAKAVELLTQALQADPRNAEACFMLGDSYLEMRNSGKAIEYFRKTLQLKPDHVVAVINLAMIYQREQNYDAAIPYFRKAAQMGGVPGSNFTKAELDRLAADCEVRKSFKALCAQSFPAEHKHFIGGCTGSISFSPETFRYADSGGKHNFTFPLKSLVSISFAGDKFSFKSGGKDYDFKMRGGTSAIQSALMDYLKLLR